MTTRRFILWALALLVAGLVLFLPLRVALAPAGDAITARAVAGPVWRGRIAGLTAGPLVLGDVDAGLDPLALLTGRREIWLQREGDGAEMAPLAARFGSGWGGDRVRIETARLPLAGLGDLPPASLALDGVAADFADGRCLFASGTASVRIDLALGGLPGGLTLTGPVRCAQGRLVLPLKGPAGMETLVLRVLPDGTWNADLAVQGLPPEMAVPLLEQGFRQRAGGALGLSASGRF